MAKTSSLVEELDATINSASAPSALGNKLKGLDMSKVKDGYTLIPDGTSVEFEVAKVEAGKTQKGDDKFTFELHCLTAPYVGAKVWDQVVIMEATLWKLKSVCKAAGLADEQGNFTGDSEQDFKGKILKATVIVETYNGVDRNKIKGGYSAPVGGASINGGGSDDDAPDFD